MESKICSKCNTEKSIISFYNKYSECKDCNSKRGLKCYYDNEDKIVQQRKGKYVHFEDVVKTCNELDNRTKFLEEKPDKKIILSK